MSRYTASLLLDLAHGGWTCGSYFYSTMRPTFAQRFSEVNAEARAATGADRIQSRPCQQHKHRCFEYRDTFASKPQQLSLIGARGAA